MLVDLFLLFQMFVKDVSDLWRENGSRERK